MTTSNTIRPGGNRATIKMMGLNPLTLAFKNNLEEPFKKKYFQDSLFQFRVAFALVMLLYALFSVLDKLLADKYSDTFFVIRFYYVLPVLLIVLIISFTRFFEAYWQRLLTLSFIVAGSGIALMTKIFPENYAYYSGMMLIFSAGYFFIKLRFFYATISGWVTMIIFNVMFIFQENPEFATLVTANFFYVSANIIGMVAAFYIELYTRRDFYFQIKLEEERQKVIEINKSLEQKVNERTSELKKKNEELILAKDQAETSDKMKSIFLGNVSHELRTPLNAITGYSQLILLEDKLADEIAENAQIIFINGQKLEKMIDLIVEISKIESGVAIATYDSISINELILETIEKFREVPHLAEKNIEVKTFFELPDDKMIATAEKKRIKQIFENLIENAIKFTRQGHVEIGYQLKGDKIEFFVKDTGEGIPEEIQERLFDSAMQFAGNQTHNEKGAGLGLRFCNMIVKLYNGEIWFDSKLGEGTNFYFTLPLKPAS